MIKLDTTAAWAWANATISANREVLLALAGVFFLLPRLVVGLFAPELHIEPNMSAQDLQAAVRAGYLATLPWVLPATLFEAVGTLAMLALITDRGRPTVRDALTAGLRGLGTYIAGELIYALGISCAGGVVIALATLSGVPSLAGMALGVALAALAYGFVRLVLLAPVVAVEREVNPVRALARAWALARGHTGRLLLMLLVLGVVALVIMLASVDVVGALVALAAGPDGGRIAGTVVSAVLDAGFAVYFVAILAGVHRQLAGPSVGGAGIFG